MYSDLVALTPEQYFKQITKRLAEIKAVSVSVATKEDHSSQSTDLPELPDGNNLQQSNYVSFVVQ